MKEKLLVQEVEVTINCAAWPRTRSKHYHSIISLSGPMVTFSIRGQSVGAEEIFQALGQAYHEEQVTHNSLSKPCQYEYCSFIRNSLLELLTS